jgi:hypothetical protein
VVQFLAWARDFSLHHSVWTSSKAQPASYPVGIRTLFPQLKLQGHKFDHSPPSELSILIQIVDLENTLYTKHYLQAMKMEIWHILVYGWEKEFGCKNFKFYENTRN